MLYRLQCCEHKTLTGHNVFLQLSEGSPAERAHQEVILAFMSMIDDTEMEAAFEKIPHAAGGEKRLIVWILLLREGRPLLLCRTHSY